MRERLNFNWEGSRKKHALDAEKKVVLRTYVNIYYPESRTNSSWSACVGKINEALRRTYRPKGQRLFGLDAGDDELGDLQDYADDMCNASITDIPTPTFMQGYSSYQDFLNGEYI